MAGYGGYSYSGPSNQSSFGSGGGSSSGQSQSSPTMIPGMQSVYNQLLGLNQQNYGNMLGLYQPAMQNVGAGEGLVSQQYQGLTPQIMNTLGMGQVLGQNGNWGVAGPAATAIGQAFAQSEGSTQQNLVNAGLGNSTVLGNEQNQNALYAGQAYAGLGAQLAQTAAGYQAQEGNLQAASMQQGVGLQTGLSQGLMGNLAGYHFTNTAGNLVGQQSTSTNQANNANLSNSNASHAPSMSSSGGGAGGGMSGGGLGAGYNLGGGYAGGAGAGNSANTFPLGFANWAPVSQQDWMQQNPQDSGFSGGQGYILPQQA